MVMVFVVEGGSYGKFCISLSKRVQPLDNFHKVNLKPVASRPEPILTIYENKALFVYFYVYVYVHALQYY